jgi:GNAT superfamily N-acetyltransferase
LSSTEANETVIRPYRADDLGAVYEVCVRTADAGGDARGIYRGDELMPNLFAGPYLLLDPDLAFVLDSEGSGVVGYVVGTADTRAFVGAYRDRWIPRLAHHYPEPSGEATEPDDIMIALHYRPERMILPELASYPAHLHIDLLPSFQRCGHGRRLIAAFLTAAHRRGAPAVHVGMLTANTGARTFYDRLGFHEIDVADPGPLSYLGRSTSSMAAVAAP